MKMTTDPGKKQRRQAPTRTGQQHCGTIDYMIECRGRKSSRDKHAKAS